MADHRDRDIVAFAPDTVSHSGKWGDREAPYLEIIEPRVQWLYWIGNNNARIRRVEIEIRNSEDETVTLPETNGHHGFNSFRWNLKIPGSSGTRKNASYLEKGDYKLILKTGKNSDEVPFTIQ